MNEWRGQTKNKRRHAAAAEVAPKNQTETETKEENVNGTGICHVYMKNVKSFDIVDFSMHYAYDVPNNAFDRKCLRREKFFMMSIKLKSNPMKLLACLRIFIYIVLLKVRMRKYNFQTDWIHFVSSILFIVISSFYSFGIVDWFIGNEKKVIFVSDSQF